MAVQSVLPGDLDTLSLSLVTTRAGTFRPTSIHSVDVAVKEFFPKRHGEFTDDFFGGFCQAVNLTISDTLSIKYVRLDPNDTSARERVLLALTIAEDTSSSLHHPGISPVWPLKSYTKPIPAVATPWFSNGNVLEYMQKPGNVVVDKLDIVKQVASAVAYMHAIDKVHGNITPMNIMITDDGKACVSDTGLNFRLRHAIHSDIWPVPSGWMFKAPEELEALDDPSSFEPTKPMDVYTFASSIYSIFASAPPFPSHLYGRGIKEIMSHGHKLEKPAEITGPLWSLLNQCWSFIPGDRPSMSTIEAALMEM